MASQVRSPSSVTNNTGVGSIAWSNPGNAVSSNNVYARASLSSSQITNYLWATNFSFSLPSSATVTGVVARVEHRASASSAIQVSTIRLIVGGAVTGNNKATSTRLPTSDTYWSYGSSSDLWGLASLSPSQVNASNFGVAVSYSASASATVYVDHIELTVYYYDTQYGSALLSATATLAVAGQAILHGIAAFEATATLAAAGDHNRGEVAFSAIAQMTVLPTVVSRVFRVTQVYSPVGVPALKVVLGAPLRTWGAPLLVSEHVLDPETVEGEVEGRLDGCPSGIVTARVAARPRAIDRPRIGLPFRPGELRPQGHVELYWHGQLVFSGRVASYTMTASGEVSELACEGYWALLRDVVTSVSTGELSSVAANLIALVAPKLQRGVVWETVGVNLDATNNQLANRPALDILAQIARAATADGLPWDILFWPDRTVELRVRRVPSVARYVVAVLASEVEIDVDPSQVASEILATYRYRVVTSGSQTETVTASVTVSDPRVTERWGIVRTAVIDLGESSPALAQAAARRELARRAEPVVSMADLRLREGDLTDLGGRAVSLHEVRPGDGVLVPGIGVMLVTKTRWSSSGPALTLSLGEVPFALDPFRQARALADLMRGVHPQGGGRFV